MNIIGPSIQGALRIGIRGLAACVTCSCHVVISSAASNSNLGTGTGCSDRICGCDAFIK
jgi:hypothetical protein